MTPETTALPPRRCASKLVIGTLVIGGLALLTLGIGLLVPALRSVSWPSVQGVVTGHRIESAYLNRSMNYQVGVDYAYEVEHTRHTGHAFSHSTDPLPMSYPSREAAEAAYASDPGFREWQAGQVVTVSYDPLAPANSVLQKGANRLAWAICFLGAGLLGIAAWERRKLRRRTATS